MRMFAGEETEPCLQDQVLSDPAISGFAGS
jgi:hypothetical protein